MKNNKQKFPSPEDLNRKPDARKLFDAWDLGSHITHSGVIEDVLSAIQEAYNNGLLRKPLFKV